MSTTRVVKNPDGVEIRKNGKRIARFTNGAQTVTLLGPRRSFRDGNVTVTHNVWVRLTPEPHAGRHDEQWLDDALAANQAGAPDLLAIACQYLDDAEIIEADGLVIAGPARYGPPGPKEPKEGSDFNDFLGITWKYPLEPTPTDPPEKKQFGCLDCSGHVRMVLGYRTHEPNLGAVVPLSFSVMPHHLPRRAYQMFASAPGVLLTVRADGKRPNTEKLRPGDLTFFKADEDDANEADHVGFFIGADLDGGLRFVSSRKKADGPMFTNIGGASILTGNGLYARSFVGARRI